MSRLRRYLVAIVLMIALLVIIGVVLRPDHGSPAPVDSVAPSATRVSERPSPEPTMPSPALATPVSTSAAVTPPGSNPAPSHSGTAQSLIDLLTLLPVRAEARAGYERSLFIHWIDADGDGCDTRREVLIAEAIVAPVVSSGCQLSGGAWHSLYDGIDTTIASTFDIDHLVPLAEAWDSGASTWTPDRRMRFANDLDVPWSLIAVSASSNRAKSDSDPPDWMPPLLEVRCTYVSAWLATKVRWSLAIDAREHDFLEPLAGSCSESLSVLRAP